MVSPSSRSLTGKAPRVGVVAPSLRILGGQAVAADRLVDRLNRSGLADASLVEVNPALPGPFRLLQRVKYLRTFVTSIAYLGMLIRRVPRLDVIHAFSASYWSFLLAPVPAMLIGRLFGKAVVLHYHSGEAADHLARWGWHVKPLLRLAHAVVVPSRYLADVFRHHGLVTSAIPNFVDDPPPSAVEGDSGNMLLLANRNLEPMYNVEAVLEAFALVRTRFPRSRLRIVGDGSRADELASRAVALGLHDVEFTGHVSPEEMFHHYRDADVYVNASLIDNMPLSLIEANAAGLPVVSSDAGGIPYMVEPGRTALLVPAGDAPALAGAILQVLEDRELAARLAHEGRRWYERHFRWEAVGPQWSALYRRLLHARRPGAFA